MLATPFRAARPRLRLRPKDASYAGAWSAERGRCHRFVYDPEGKRQLPRADRDLRLAPGLPGPLVLLPKVVAEALRRDLAPVVRARCRPIDAQVKNDPAAQYEKSLGTSGGPRQVPEAAKRTSSSPSSLARSIAPAPADSGAGERAP